MSDPVVSHHVADAAVGLVCWKGDALPDARIQRGSRATALAWHPTRHAIACGWETGHVSVHDVMPTAAVVSAVEPPSLHSDTSTIIAVAWTSDGSRLLAGFAVSSHSLLNPLMATSNIVPHQII